MGISRGKDIVTDGLIFYMDAANPKSYVSGSTTCNNMFGQVNGSLINGTAFSTDNNGVFDFDGTDDYIDCGDNNAFSFGNGVNDFPFTISCWIKMDSTGFRIMSKWDESSSNSEFYFMYINPGTFIFLINDKSTGGMQYIRSNGTWSPFEGEWANITGTYNGVGGNSAKNGLELYINGVVQPITRFSDGTYTAIEPSTSSLHIGNWESFYADGKISVTTLYNKELSASELLQNYNALKARYNL